MNTIIRLLRRLATLAGIGAVIYGLTLPTDGSQALWLACLFAGALLIATGAWPTLRGIEDTFGRSAVNIAAALALAFGLVAVQFARVQVLHYSDIAGQSGADPISGDVLSNPRQSLAGLDVQRGDILDRNGVVLAESVQAGGVFHRRYPVSSTAYVCGFYSPLRYGLAGIEAAFDDELSGRETGSPFRDAFDRLRGRERAGADVHLTLDAALQAQAHSQLAGRTGAVVVVDVQTGAVIVLASNPVYDPERLNAVDAATAAAATDYWQELQDDPHRPLVMRSTLGLYTPGSTFKTVTAAAAIDAGIAGPDTMYRDDGQIVVDGRVIVEPNRPDDSIDTWSLTQGLGFSLNVVFAQVGLALGAEMLREYASAFGFTDAVPFELPVTAGQIESAPGFLDAPTALADTAFGQGQLLITPLAMAMVAASFANGGALMRPYLVDQVVAPGGDIIESADPAVWNRPVSPETAAQVRDMMIAAVETGYVGAAAIPGLVVGGKTGTAETGSGASHAWFIGFAGDREPRYAVAVVLEHGGSDTSQPIAIGRAMLNLSMALPD
jgi:peptidoglycan glycosyltransferase